MEKPHVDVGRRIRFYRDSRKLTQAVLSKAVGFNDRQTLSDIEAGKRSVSPQELAQIAKTLDVELSTFFDPFRLVGEGGFNFRASDAPAREIDAFEDLAGRWVATYRELRRQAGISPARFGQKLELTRDSSFEDAEASAEALRAVWNLGDVPSGSLQQAIERELEALVLYVDAPARISGAALHLPGLQTILVNRKESPARRAFDLAHELFHLLTWDAMTPERIEPWKTVTTKGNRIEQLANKFAAALLMPRGSVMKRWDSRGSVNLSHWIVATARELRVSTEALQWRLVGLGLMSKDDVAKIRATPNDASAPTPTLFSAAFVASVYEAVDAGRLSMRRASQLLDLPLSDFADLCRNYGRQLSYDA